MTSQQIEQICKQYGIENYTINPTGVVDVDGDIDFVGQNLEKLPLRFGRISGNFNCSGNQLTTLKGAPKEVVGNFYCSDNKVKFEKSDVLNACEVGGTIYN